MKSKTCLCNGTILKKDLTRFAPLVLLTGLILWGVGAVLSEVYKTDYGVGEYLEPGYVGMIMGSCLGLFSAIFLFTYLTKKSECDAIHALPIRRDTLFFTKILAAFVQVTVPFSIFYIFFPGERGWAYQMAVTLCPWLFNFGLATLAMMFSGRRLAGYIIYCLIEGLPGMVYSVVNNLYIPLLPGVYLGNSLKELSPLTAMIDMDLRNGKMDNVLLPMLIYALVGVGFLAAALVTYRRRKLERAGDFLAVKWMEPVFACGLGIYASMITVSIAGVTDGSIWLALAIGLAIGYFAARMFFARSIRVFDKKSLLGWVGLVAIMAASLYVTSLDPLGLVNRVPETDQIESVGLYDSNYLMIAEYGYDYSGSAFTTTDPGDIEQLRQLHKNLLLTNEQTAEGKQIYQNRFYLEYTLKSGAKVVRTYYITGYDDLKQLKYFMSQPEALVGSADIEEVLASIKELRANGVNGGLIHTERAFLEVFLEECEAGWMYTPDSDGQSSWDIQFYSEEFGYRVVDIPLTAQKTIAWLENYFSKKG